MSLIIVEFKSYFKRGVIKSLPESSEAIPETPQCICKKGSLTVEAAIILPLLACFFAFLLFFFRILQVQLVVQEALEETGRTLAIVSEKELENGEQPAYFAMAKALISAKLLANENISDYVIGGALGVVLLTSELEGDYIELEVNYAMKFPVSLLGTRYMWMSQKACFRKWTGWHPMDVSKPTEVIVYVTKYGEAYHRRKSCPYLSLSTKAVLRSEVNGLRNRNDEKYAECEDCEKENLPTGTVYVTDYGDCYHYTLTCRGLKRTIYEKRLSEVGGKSACPKCWK